MQLKVHTALQFWTNNVKYFFRFQP